jgi:hypothetical protein
LRVRSRRRSCARSPGRIRHAARFRNGASRDTRRSADVHARRGHPRVRTSSRFALAAADDFSDAGRQRPSRRPSAVVVQPHRTP